MPRTRSKARPTPDDGAWGKLPGEDETGYRARRPVPAGPVSAARIGILPSYRALGDVLPALVVGIGPRTLPDAAEVQLGCVPEHETPPDYHASR